MFLAFSFAKSALPAVRQHLIFSLCTLTLVASGTAAAQGPSSSGVAVLNDGRVFQGNVEEVPGGYRVNYPGGSSILPFNEISVTSATMVGAYEAFRDSIRTPSADSHLRLAEWCLGNGLYAQADIEVKNALRLEPMRTDAKVLLRQLDAMLRPELLANTPPVTTAPPPVKTAAINVGAFVNPSEQSGSGLSRETQLLYMRKVQPLIINKCGNASCHGPDVANQMKLRNVRMDTTAVRGATEHNLGILFGLIDYKNPARSPLLVKPQQPTPQHQQLFAGPRQQAQLDLLETWVRQVANERDADTPFASIKASSSPGPTRSILIQPGQPMRTPAGVIVESLPPTAVTATVETNSPDAEFLKGVRQSHRPDAFDPEEFNRQMHAPRAALP